LLLKYLIAEERGSLHAPRSCCGVDGPRLEPRASLIGSASEKECRNERVAIQPGNGGRINSGPCDGRYRILSVPGASFIAVEQLQEHIDAFIAASNVMAEAFVWTTKKVDQRRFKNRRITQLRFWVLARTIII
jgi:hypothetical protein